jgi:hypothetical protein
MPAKPTQGDIRDIYRATVDDLYDFVARRCHGDRGLAEDITQRRGFARSASGASMDCPTGPAPGSLESRCGVAISRARRRTMLR